MTMKPRKPVGTLIDTSPRRNAEHPDGHGNRVKESVTSW